MVPYVSADVGGSSPKPIAARGNGINAQRRKGLIGILANGADGQKLGVTKKVRKGRKRGQKLSPRLAWLARVLGGCLRLEAQATAGSLSPPRRQQEMIGQLLRVPLGGTESRPEGAAASRQLASGCKAVFVRGREERERTGGAKQVLVALEYSGGRGK
ncbi:hypothetical protein CI102_12329 [Trichoderma harzianum]|uniref:Uncharacterized protein n=1 Tax=Trichoderma harzianum CBS 226.95 TaxID=983964 RepID=A0A2T4AU18_TRIHA|nr:hypothetical protein M431DRAFT_185517 [Trichoderma harzianum CBS 226.95]PKK43251.1 hypothetical protein CI102_12329 [Trichoderma harzianum]PTB60541.1 hypothetical protein M431DRAFT_185517 [Trichoderma harzianum CBS 226.95]